MAGLPDLGGGVPDLGALKKTAEAKVNWKAMKVDPDDTILITLPKSMPQQMVSAIAADCKRTFPDNRIAVMPEELGFHTEKKLAELLTIGTDLATLVEEISVDDDDEKGQQMLDLAEAWRNTVEERSGGDDSPDVEG